MRLEHERAVDSKTMSDGVAFLIIGIGNTDRADDGVGAYVTQRLQRLLAQTPRVRFLLCRQLTPERAVDVAAAEQVIFVDARIGLIPGETQCRRPRAASDNDDGPLGHAFSPQSTLRLATLYGSRCREARLYTVTARSFAFTRGLSAEVKAGAQRVVEQIIAVIEAHRASLPDEQACSDAFTR